MPENAEKFAKAHQELVRVLEEAVRVGADSIELGWAKNATGPQERTPVRVAPQIVASFTPLTGTKADRKGRKSKKS